MRRLLQTELGERLYRKRSEMVEPMFGHTKPTAPSIASSGEADRLFAPSGD